MSLVRNAAQTLADFTVKHASSGSRPWAEAIANELDAIEGDWQALAWAFGSLRVLAHHRIAPHYSAEELTAAAEKYADRQRNRAQLTWLGRNLGVVICLFVAGSEAIQAASHKDAIGNILLMASQLSLAASGMLQLSGREIPDDGIPGSLLRYYRQELARAMRLAPVLIVPACLLVAFFAYEFEKRFTLALFMGLAWLSILVSGAYTYWMNRRKVEQINAILSAE